VSQEKGPREVSRKKDETKEERGGTFRNAIAGEGSEWLTAAIAVSNRRGIVETSSSSSWRNKNKIEERKTKRGETKGPVKLGLVHQN
jgi:hypothetical protein